LGYKYHDEFDQASVLNRTLGGDHISKGASARS